MCLLRSSRPVAGMAAAIGLFVLAPFGDADDAPGGILGVPNAGSASRTTDLPPPNLTVVDSQWLHNKLGIDNEVPAPWTPLTRSGNTVRCWDRTYMFAGGLPSAIRGREKELLSAPMQLVAKIGGQTYRQSHNRVKFDRERGDRIEFGATGDLGPLKLTAKNWIEFDGLVQIKFDLDAGAGVDVESLDLEIPMPASVAKYYFFCNGNWGSRTLGAIGTETGWKWGTAWWPLCWIGDDDRGLSVVAESSHGWSTPTGGHVHELLRGQEGVLWRIHILGKPTRLSKITSYLFGVQGTPMKPLRKELAGFNPFSSVWSALPSYFRGRSANCWPDLMGNIYPDTDQGLRELKELGINSLSMFDMSLRLNCYPEFRDPQRVKRAIALWHKAGLTVTQYYSPCTVGYLSDVYKRHQQEWVNRQANGRMWCPPSGPLPNGSAGFVVCCPHSSYADFLAWGVDLLMREYDLDGLGYVDCPGPYYCANARHGCQGMYPIFSEREVWKRWWKIVKKYKPNGLIWAHFSENFPSPFMAFCDAYTTGEEFRTTVHPLQDLDPTRLAVTMTGLQWGCQPIWMFQCAGEQKENSMWAATRILPYGAIPDHGWVDTTVIVPAEKAKLKFGVGAQGTNFYAPHQLPEWLKMNKQDFVIGAWKRADGDVLLIISNFDAKYKNAKIGRAVRTERPVRRGQGCHHGCSLHLHEQHLQHLCPRQLVPDHLDQTGQR